MSDNPYESQQAKTSNATPPPSTAVARGSFEQDLQAYEPQLVAALPNHISVDKFKRTVVTALNQNPDLAKADRRSLFTACVRAAHDGLFPDGREAALVVFNTKNKKTGEWRKLVQYMPMVYGIIKRARNSGELAAISAHVVFDKDEFTYELGEEPKIIHKPALGDRGKPVGVYAIAKLTSGEIQREVMSVAEIEKVRSVSRSKDDGPWVAWWEEMARKTVIRRLSKMLPNSSDIDDVIRHEEEQYGAHGEEPAPATAARPTRQMFTAGAQITDVESDEETNGEAQSSTSVQSYEVYDHTGVCTEVVGAILAGEIYVKCLEEAATAGPDAVKTVYENNVALVAALDEAGHGKLSKELGLIYAKVREEAEAKAAAKAKPETVADKTETQTGDANAEAQKGGTAAPAQQQPKPETASSGKQKAATGDSRGKGAPTQAPTTQGPPRSGIWTDESYTLPMPTKPSGVADGGKLRDDLLFLAEEAGSVGEIDKLIADNDARLQQLQDFSEAMANEVRSTVAACRQRLEQAAAVAK